ncbi:MAG: GatB/YqeY domain-containing protein [Candidatus Omnitrophota bacterium]
MLEEKILNDYKEAMKSKDTIKSSTLSMLRAEIINVAIAKKKKSLDDSEVITVIKKQVKQHQDSIEQFKQGNRLDLADKETRELEILKAYLPAELPIEEIKKIIEEALSSTQAKELKDMGKVMKEVTSKIAGRADGKLVSDLVRERLSGANPA